MFTGIIEGTGSVKTFREKDEGVCEIEVQSDFPLESVNVGESIAVNGCCLTVTSRLGNTFWADLGPETLALTTLSELEAGSAVNLERPLKMGERLGGHIVQGHVDGVGVVEKIEELGGAKKITLRAPARLKHYLLPKVSIAVDGISLTLNECSGEFFSITIIPHTNLRTTFANLKVKAKVNLEVDIVGKYVEKLTHLDSQEYEKGSEITKEFLKKHGF